MSLAENRHPWLAYPSTYREQEVQLVLQWIRTGASGSIIGLNGSGKSDLIGFLCHRTDILQRYLPPEAQQVTLLLMDLNSLPDNSLAALFRVILRTFYEHQHRFDVETQWLITHLYVENRAATDPFLSQSALRELLLYLQQRRHRVVFALDRFDLFCSMVTPEMGDALRGLRDSFKDTLSYIASMRLGLSYLPEPELLGDLHRLIDQHVCYVGPMNEPDTRETILRRIDMAPDRPTDSELAQMWQLSGGYPSLVMAICRWWLAQSTRPAPDQWQEQLLAQASVRHRLEDIWAGLTQEEQLVMAEIQKSIRGAARTQNGVGQRYEQVLAHLAERRLCLYRDGTWRIFSDLFAAHVGQVGGRSRGKITFDATAKTLYHGEEPLTGLTPKESALLQFLVELPYLQHSYTDLIVAVWNEEERYHGVSNDSLYQLVRTLRLKIEPNPSQPVYIVNWRGKPEGGYLFYPEGRPR
ncbi:MAG TPA: winged helix-turn-helix domain-containing protein [Caldilineaceae bacterium]|nr:winged helix-turn-helix domain-containing protein [Caldilineaceae bacterium]